MHMSKYRGYGVRGNWQNLQVSHPNHLFPSLVGYVEELAKDLFTLTNSELNDVQNRMAGKYQSQIPASFSSQFPDRVNKNDAAMLFDCLVFEMLYIKKFKPNLNVQADSIRTKLFV